MASTDFFNMNSNLSIFIPRVFNNISQERIKECFEQLNIGEVERVDLVDRETDESSKGTRMAFIHFNKWYDTASSINLRTKIENPDETAKVVYDDPYYWILLPNKNPKTKDQVKNEIMFTHQAKQIDNLWKKVQLLEETLSILRDKTQQNGVNEELREFILSPSYLESTGDDTNIIEKEIANISDVFAIDEQLESNQEMGASIDANEEEEHPEWENATREDIVESPITLNEIVLQTQEFEQTQPSARNNWWNGIFNQS